MTGGEILSLFVGQPGLQIANVAWRQFAKEHGIGMNGNIEGEEEEPSEDKNTKSKKKQETGMRQTLFREHSQKRFIPRSIFFDTDPTTADTLRFGRLKNLVDSRSIIRGKEDGAMCYAIARYGSSNELKYRVQERLRRETESCDRIASLQIISSPCGGTGSGLVPEMTMSFIDEILNNALITGCMIYPSPTYGTCPAHCYNTVLYMHAISDSIDLNLCFDNETLFSQCEKVLSEEPTFTDINFRIGLILSGLTQANRFPNAMGNIQSLSNNLIPFIGVNYLSCFYEGQIIPGALRRQSTEALTERCFEKGTTSIAMDLSRGRCMCSALLYRGPVEQADIAKAVEKLKDEKISFAPWAPCGIKLGISRVDPVTLDDYELLTMTCTKIFNHTRITDVFDRLLKDYETLSARVTHMTYMNLLPNA